MLLPENKEVLIRQVQASDEAALISLEKASFKIDRLSKRRMRHWISASNRLFLVAIDDDKLVGYCLILLHSGTRLARLYSIAIDKTVRRLGLGKRLLHEAEENASRQGRLFMRLEVAQNNMATIHLYKKMNYVAFDTIEDYYEDHQDALRMQKRIRYIPENLLSRKTPWFQQTTDFTCGPAALMMAMGSLDNKVKPNQSDELDIWRTSTTIFMTSGHGGCHPVGLALAAIRKGFKAEVFINQKGTAFIESVRNPEKKQILEVVDADFYKQAKQAGAIVHRSEIQQRHIAEALNKGSAVIILISTYRMNGKKSPHWVTVTGMDDQCFYMHDPDPTDAVQIEIDCQHIPVARADFELMSSFGRQRLRTAVIISQ
tara:strand:- start:1114 stop:2229 length:1116 start_codon:yes stop_codon:yes gene_type:complete